MGRGRGLLSWAVVELTFWGTTCTVRALVESADLYKGVSALMKLQFSLHHCHAQPLGLDTTSTPCYLNLLSPSTVVSVPPVSRPVTVSQPNLCPPSPRPSLQPSLGRALVHACPRVEMLACELLMVL